MLIRMKTNITGYRNGEPWPGPGELLECSDSEAADLIANGYAAATDSEETDADATADDSEEPAEPEAAAAGSDGDGPPTGTVDGEATKPVTRRGARKRG